MLCHLRSPVEEWENLYLTTHWFKMHSVSWFNAPLIIWTKTYFLRSGRTLTKHWVIALNTFIQCTNYYFKLKRVSPGEGNLELYETLIQCTLVKLIAFYHIDPLKPEVNEMATLKHFCFPYNNTNLTHRKHPSPCRQVCLCWYVFCTFQFFWMNYVVYCEINLV